MPLTSNVTSEVLSVRQRGGYLVLQDVSIVDLSGADAESFLQGRTSNDVKALKPGQGQLSSLLDRKGYVLAFITVHRLGKDRIWILSQPDQSATLLKEFATYHFREQIEYKEIAHNFKLLAVHGPGSKELIYQAGARDVADEEYSISQQTLCNSPCHVITRSTTGDPGFVLVVGNDNFDSVIQEFRRLAKEANIAEISSEALETLRIEAGHPLFGIDFSQEEMLPETGLEQYAASYNKGCFQGQEVLARVKTYGAPRRALVGLVFDSPPAVTFESNAAFSINGEEAGTIKSNVFSPTLKQFIAMAYIARDYRLPDKKVTIETKNGKFDATVKFLPFYSASSSKAKAKALFDSALKEFANGSEDKAVTMLREVIELDHHLTDAYESLGVILSRHEQYDEAIALMHRLQSLDPNSIMAHTNLSIYYMHQGDKERAEEEKAIAMSLRMSQLAREHALKKKEEEDKQKLAAEAEKRLDMFRQVLQIDPDDFLANNGVGTVYVELEKFEESIPYLQKAIAVKPTHTVAYLALGKAYENLDRITDAINIYKAGIDVAAKRGDITPMKEMQLLLANVENKAS